MELPMMYLMDLHPPAFVGEAEDKEEGGGVGSCSNSSAPAQSGIAFSIFYV